MKLLSIQPRIDIRNLNFILSKDEEGYVLKNFTLRTSENSLRASAEVESNEIIGGNLNLEVKDLHLSEFEMFLPDLYFPPDPDINLESKFDQNSLNMRISIKDGRQNLLLNGYFHNFSDFPRSIKNDQFNYELKADFFHINLGNFLRNPGLNSDLSGKIFLKGKGIEPEKSEIDFTMKFQNSTIGDHLISNLGIKGEYVNENGWIALDFADTSAQISLAAEFQNLLQNPQYSVQGQISHLQLNKIPGAPDLDSDINAELKLQGIGFIFDDLQGNLSLICSPSRIYNIQIDSLSGNFSVNEGTIRTADLFIQHPSGKASLVGSFQPGGIQNIRYAVDLQNMDFLQQWLVTDSLKGKAHLTGHLTGLLDSLQNFTELALNDVEYQQVYFDTIYGIGSLIVQQNNFKSESHIKIENIQIGSQKLDSLELEAVIVSDSSSISLEINQSQDISAQLQANLLWGDFLHISISQLDIHFYENHWQGGGANSWIEWADKNLTIHQFDLQSIADSSAYVDIEGNINLKDVSNLDINVEKFSIGMLKFLLPENLILDGLLSLQLKLQGVSDDPKIWGKFEIQNFRLDQFENKELSGEFDLKESLFKWDLAILENKEKIFSFTGDIPARLILNPYNFTIPKTEPIQARFLADGLSLKGFLGKYLQVDQADGILNTDLQILNTLENPHLYGFVSLDNGIFQLYKLGIDYRNIQLKIKADSTRIDMEKFRISREKGFIEVGGYLNFSDNLLEGEIKSTDFRLIARDFYVAKHKDFEILIDSDNQLQNQGKSANLDGTITVKRSSFYVPALQERLGDISSEEAPDRPLLVKALDKSKEKQKLEVQDSLVKNLDINTTSPRFNRLKTNVNILIPRNSWLKGPNLLMELDGNIELIKREDYFQLFGRIGIVQGHYTVIGKRFNIIEGNITFKGGKELNPELVLVAEYEIRTSSGDKKILRLYLSGELKKLDYRFTLDGSNITEIDAVSYIAFGKSNDELTFGEQAGMEKGALALDFASSMLSTELSKSIGQGLQLDYLEIKGKDNWQSATFVVGKYITNELFISYQREFGDTRDNDIAPETVTVEYELTRNIYFQLIEGDSKAKGVDVIFKIEQ
jgi:translocation and assembly module TamB